MPREHRHARPDPKPRLLALFALALLMLNFPLLSLWDRELTVAGLPLLPLALFVLWGALIAAVARVMERGD